VVVGLGGDEDGEGGGGGGGWWVVGSGCSVWEEGGREGVCAWLTVRERDGCSRGRRGGVG